MDLSFSGAGFMGCYYFGVVNCWDKYIPRDRVRRVAGASAGSLIAAYYLMDLPLDTCLKEIIEMTEDVRARPLGVFDRSNQIVDVLPKRLAAILPEDAHKRVNGRLFVCMTRLRDMKAVVVNEFESKQDLIDALNCSCFIPVWSGNHVSTFRGVKYIDGGFTNNLPVFDEHTIRISCFSGASDIAPYDSGRANMLTASLQGMPLNLNWKNLKRGGRALWPPPPSYIIGLLERGFHDTKDFILSNDLIQCNRCFRDTGIEFQPIYSQVAPTISPAASPAVSRAGSFMDLSQLMSSGSFRRSSSASKRAARTRLTSEAEKRRTPLAPVRIKPHRQLAQTFQWEPSRLKSGRQIKRKALERANTNAAKQQQAESKVSFASKLREKLQRVASSSSAPADSADLRTSKPATEEREQVVMPTIVVVQPEDERDLGQQQEQQRGRTRAGESILDIIKSQDDLSTDEHESGRHSPADEPQHQNGSKGRADRKRRNRSLSSGDSVDSSSEDSAVGLDTPSPPALAAGATDQRPRRAPSGSPSERYFASAGGTTAASHPAHSDSPPSAARGQQEQPNELASSHLLTDRFHFAPSPLPSCPPSPNLNRHCTECIRMRQQARMDDIDDKIRREAALYGAMKSKDPEREFNSLRARLTHWFRQFGAPKYSYSFAELDAPADPNASPTETSLPLKKTRRRAGSVQ